jgi:hypothetical protein
VAENDSVTSFTLRVPRRARLSLSFASLTLRFPSVSSAWSSSLFGLAAPRKSAPSRVSLRPFSHARTRYLHGVFVSSLGFGSARGVGVAREQQEAEESGAGQLR